VAAKGDKLKISDIYPEGRRLAASFQISDKEAGEREKEFEKEQKGQEAELREQKKKPKLKKITSNIQRRYIRLAIDNLRSGSTKEEIQAEAKRLASEEGYSIK